MQKFFISAENVRTFNKSTSRIPFIHHRTTLKDLTKYRKFSKLDGSRSFDTSCPYHRLI